LNHYQKVNFSVVIHLSIREIFMKNLFYYSLLMLMLAWVSPSWGQNVSISGTIRAKSDKQPVPGAAVKVKGKNLGTAADANGKFTLSVGKNDQTLFISSVGYETQEVNLNGKTTLEISLESQNSNLDEVVVIGFGSAKKIDITGSVATINPDVLTKQPNANAIASLQGRVAGVSISNIGEIGPRKAPLINIRGVSSTSNEILYDVDGVLVDNINFLNPNDVESMSILKDPSSLSIYGMRAANGVIAIKTKSGKKADRVRVDYNGFVGVQQVQNVPKLTNAAQYITLINEMNKYNANPGEVPKVYNLSEFSGDTDWFKEVMKTSSINTIHNVNVAGGSDKSTYAVGLSYNFQEGNVKAGQGIYSTGNDMERYTLNFKLNTDLTEKLRFNVFGNYSGNQSNNVENPFGSAYAAAPVIPVYDKNGGYGTFPLGSNIGSSADKNPRADLDLFRGRSKWNTMLLGGSLEYEVIKGLTLKTEYNINNYNEETYEYRPAYNYGIFTQNPAEPVGVGTYSKRKATSDLKLINNTNRDWFFNNTATYRFNIANLHNFTVLAGVTQNELTNRRTTLQGINVPFNGDDSGMYLDLASGNITAPDADNSGVRTRYSSYIGRLMYNYDDKYLLNATLRRDGSSSFSADNRIGYFPAVGIGWVLSRESFLSNVEAINFLKIKASWGKAGNGNVPRAFDLTASAPNPYFFGTNKQFGSSISSTVTPISWETVEGRDIGIETKWFKNKLSVDVGYYHKTTRDAVANIRLLQIAGTGNTFTTNAADFVNKGFELDIKWENRIKENVGYGFYGNFSTNANQVTRVKGNSDQYLAGIYNHNLVVMREGSQIGSYWGYQVTGVNQKTGAFIFEDLNNDGQYDERDKKELGSPIPTFTFGFGGHLDVSNFDLSIDFQGVGGNQIYNKNRQVRYDAENFTLDFFNSRWNGEGTSTTSPSASSSQSNQLAASSFFVEDGSYFRIRALQLGYTIPKAILGKRLNKVRVFANGQNLITFSKYKGFSPEIVNTANGVWERGIDAGITPIYATYNFGVNMSF
jgi:TonB-linked SusC/RagA family outer membrane protein